MGEKKNQILDYLALQFLVKHDLEAHTYKQCTFLPVLLLCGDTKCDTAHPERCGLFVG